MPPIAVREAIVNAVVHADHAQRGRPIRLAIFDDRIEIENPGLLQFGLTLEDLPRGISKLRNRVIGRVFHAIGRVEQWGSGIQRMAAACRAAGLAQPTGSPFRPPGPRFESPRTEGQALCSDLGGSGQEAEFTERRTGTYTNRAMALNVSDRLPGDRPMSRRLTWLFVAIVALLAGWTLFWQLGRGSLNDWDEATYAEVAHEMVQTGDWLTPRWNGLPYHEKPPLMYWLMAAGLRGGLSPELAVRLPAACAGAIVILLTLLLGRALFCTWTGITAATLLLIASTAWWSNLVQLSRQGMMDVPLTALTLWTLLHWWHGRSRPRRWLWIGLSLGLAVLVKSFQAIPITDCCNDRALRRSGLAALREESQKAGTDRRWSGDHRLPAVEYRTAVSPWQRFRRRVCTDSFQEDRTRGVGVARFSYYLRLSTTPCPTGGSSECRRCCSRSGG